MDRVTEKGQMKVREQGNKKEPQIMVEGVTDFHLDHIFDCGQCFRWNQEKDGSYTGVAFGKVVNIHFLPEEKDRFSGTVMIKNSTAEDFNKIWKTYLDLERDYSKIKNNLREKEPTIATAISYGEGIRILQQEQWETVVSFIISQNNNIPRIKKCIESFCSSFGERIVAFDQDYWSFPTPEKVAALALEDLDCCKLGYRAKYILETAKLISGDACERLNAMKEASKEEAQNYLLSLSGVGPKVANCIMLFSMGKYDSFPLDVWVKKVMNQLYGFSLKDTKDMMTFAEKNFGQYGGIAQQYLFYYIRQI